jgi:hypothetical protein
MSSVEEKDILQINATMIAGAFIYCTRSTGVSILLIIFLASLNRDLSQESRCEVDITTKS